MHRTKHPANDVRESPWNRMLQSEERLRTHGSFADAVLAHVLNDIDQLETPCIDHRQKTEQRQQFRVAVALEE